MSPSMTEYVSSIRFALNFEDHKNSVQVLAGDSVFFDGSQAKFTKKDGSEVSGRAPSLRSAISMKWLMPKNGAPALVLASAPVPIDRNGDKIPGNSGDKYDPFRGGDFDEMMAKEQSTNRVSMSKEVITEDHLTVKKTGPVAVAEKKAAAAGDKLEVAGDQVEVRENVMVNSSTMVPPTRAHKTAVRRSEDYGAESTTPLKFKGVGKKEEEKKNAFTVDDTTPGVPEEATLAEVKRAVVKNEGESQGAIVVGTVKKGAARVETVEGVALKEAVGQSSETKTEEGITFKTEKTRQARTAGVKISSGGEPITEITAGMEGVVVVPKRAGLNIPLQEQKPDYLSMLPDDWGVLHWAKKEKFIKILTDKGFLRFIMSVESIKAVQDACKARLEELDKENLD